MIINIVLLTIKYLKNLSETLIIRFVSDNEYQDMNYYLNIELLNRMTYCQFFLFFYLDGSYNLIVVVFIKAMNNKHTKHTIGSGAFNSFTIGLKPVIPLAATLQIPMAVALFSTGNILLSTKLAKYDDKKPIAIPYFVNKMHNGMYLLTNSYYRL
jgi:hypothetical protein